MAAPLRVLIGTPSLTGALDVWYVHSHNQTIRLCIQLGIDLRELYLCYDSIVQNARNDIVKAALDNGFDDLIFIDADQEWDPAWVPKLLSYPVDCVGAAVRKKTDQAELYNVRAEGGPHSFMPGPDGLLTSPDMALGCGFLRFSRRALQVLWDNSEPYEVWGSGKGQSRWIFDIRPKDGHLIGEDTHVSDKLRAHGIQTYVDPAMTCGHIGMKKYTGDFAKWLAGLQAATPQQAQEAPEDDARARLRLRVVQGG